MASLNEAGTASARLFLIAKGNVSSRFCWQQEGRSASP